MCGETPDEYGGSTPFDMVIGILDKTNNSIIQEN